VRSDNGVDESERIAAVARPGVFFRGGHHARPHRGECDVASASDEVAVGFEALIVIPASGVRSQGFQP